MRSIRTCWTASANCSPRTVCVRHRYWQPVCAISGKPPSYGPAMANRCANAVVWKCARGREICRQLHEYGYEPLIKKRTDLRLSPYFSAAKFHWMIHNVPLVRKYAERGTLMAGTMDSFLIYRLTHRHATDYSNASRTQLFDIFCRWHIRSAIRMVSISSLHSAVWAPPIGTVPSVRS